MEEIKNFWMNTISNYIDNPWNIVTLIIDLIIVIVLLKEMVRILKGSRAMQLLKGIMFLILFTWISSLLNLTILNYLLTI